MRALTVSQYADTQMLPDFIPTIPGLIIAAVLTVAFLAIEARNARLP